MRKVVVAVIAAALATAALAQGEDAAALYKQRCAMCHGASGQPTAMGKKMGSGDLAAAHLSEADAKAIIANGKGKMPAYGSKLTGAQVDALAKYVASGLE